MGSAAISPSPKTLSTLVQLGMGDEWMTQVQTALPARTYGRTALEQYPRRQSTDCPEADPDC